MITKLFKLKLYNNKNNNSILTCIRMKIKSLKINQPFHILLSIKTKLAKKSKALNKKPQSLLSSKMNMLIKLFQIIMNYRIKKQKMVLYNKKQETNLKYIQ